MEFLVFLFVLAIGWLELNNRKVSKSKAEVKDIYKQAFNKDLNIDKLTKFDAIAVFIAVESELIDGFINDNYKSLSRDFSLGCSTDQYGITDFSKWNKTVDKIVCNIIVDKLLVITSQLSAIKFASNSDCEYMEYTHSQLLMGTKESLSDLRKSFNDSFAIEHKYRVSIAEIDSPSLQGQLCDIDDISDGIEYEHAISSLINNSELGWSSVVSQASGDQGLDVLAEHDSGLSVAIQTKCYSTPVGNKAVQEVLGAVAFYDTDRAMVVTNASFTKSAANLAQRSDVLLSHHNDLLSILDDLAVGETDSSERFSASY